MESVVKKLQGIGLTEYEAKAYLSLLNTHLSTASKVSEKSSVLLVLVHVSQRILQKVY